MLRALLKGYLLVKKALRRWDDSHTICILSVNPPPDPSEEGSREATPSRDAAFCQRFTKQEVQGQGRFPVPAWR